MNKKVLFILPILLSSLFSCNKKEDKTANITTNQEFIYNEVEYEEMDIARKGTNIKSLDLVGLPKEGIKAAAWDDYDIELRVTYNNNTVNSFKFWEKNIPIEMRHYLGEVGTHKFTLLYGGVDLNFDINIITNPKWDGFTCNFYNREGELLDSQKVGYYKTVEYQGPELPMKEEDEDNQYVFTGWSHSNVYIHQDMTFTAVYSMIEKRYYGLKPIHNDHIGITGLIDESGKKGSAFFALGRVKHVAALYSDVVYANGQEYTLSLKFDDYSKYWNDLNESIVKYAFDFEIDPEYNDYLFGSAYEILSSPTFATDFDSRLGYSGVDAALEDKSEVTLSHSKPYETSLNRSIAFSNSTYTINKHTEEGYYRYAVVASYDVYLHVSFTRIDKDKYEIGTMRDFIISPVYDSFKTFLQYSEDGKFENNFDQKLLLSTKGLYAMADMIDWPTWNY